MRLIDISLPLNNHTPIYPGNVPLEISIHHAMPEHATQLSKIVMGSHTGTHIDAPGHAVSGASMLDSIPFETFIGPCRVLDFSNEEGKAVTKKFLETKYIKKGERILFKTKNSLRGFETFYDDYIFLSGDAAEYLASLEVLLVGIDSLSVKERGSKDNRPHTALLSKNIPILEGVNLKDVEEGEYELICPPLKFLDIDGSPTRAVLLQLL